jgi:hypothetical protein
MAISPGPWVNVATIAHADQFDPDLSNNTDFVFAVVTP